jgi:transcriptional regulator with XRE-family HTH domain
MREKLLDLMKKEGLTSSRLAELLGIQPSGISHILAGRNKPSFDLVQKILRRFPRVNPDWLLLDSQDMYRNRPDENSKPSENTIFSESTHPTLEKAQNNQVEMTTVQSSDSTVQQPINAMIPATTPRGNVKRIIVLYEDRTFESYEVAR